MTCPACARAQLNPAQYDYTNGCDSCQARALAAIGVHVESQELGSVTPQFRDVMERVFGDGWKAHAAAVRDWGQRIGAYRRRAKG